MLDLIHFLFEDDVLSSSTKEQADAKEAVRVSLYRQFYKTEYSYTSSNNSTTYINDELIDGELTKDDPPIPVDPSAQVPTAIKPKAFIPPTSVNSASSLPFGRGIDAPLG